MEIAWYCMAENGCLNIPNPVLSGVEWLVLVSGLLGVVAGYFLGVWPKNQVICTQINLHAPQVQAYSSEVIR
jgi:hypothetical protein